MKNYPDTYRTMSSIERQATWNKIQGSISLSQAHTPSPYTGQTAHIKKTFFSRDYAVALLCVVLLSTSTSALAAADQSLPTSALYTIKLNVTEPLRSLTKTTPEARIDWEIERTSRRLEETRQLVESNTLTPEIAAQIGQHIQEHTAAAQSEIHELAQTNTDQSTILSLSLVETIEKKQEEILLANDQSTQNTLAVAFSAGTTNSSINSSISTSTETTTDTLSNADIQTQSIQSVLAVTEQIQVDTNNLIQTIATEQAPALTIATNTSTEELLMTPETSAPTDTNVITYSLVMKDIQDQIMDLEKVLDIAPVETTLVTTENPLTEINTSSESDVKAAETTDLTTSATTSVVDPTAATPLTLISPTIAAKTTESTPTETTTLSTTPTVTPETTTAPIEINTVGTEAIESLPEKTPQELYTEITAEYARLQSVTQPNQEDITTARTLRKNAEQLLKKINKKDKKAVTIESTTEIKLPAISVESIQLPVTPKPNEPITNTPDTANSTPATTTLPTLNVPVVH